MNTSPVLVLGMEVSFFGRTFRRWKLSLVVDKHRLEIAFLLDAASEFAISVCNIEKKISLIYALHFVDVL
jgi:hypothetical protein